jgi:hypothetical protein
VLSQPSLEKSVPAAPLQRSLEEHEFSAPVSPSQLSPEVYVAATYSQSGLKDKDTPATAITTTAATTTTNATTTTTTSSSVNAIFTTSTTASGDRSSRHSASSRHGNKTSNKNSGGEVAIVATLPTDAELKEKVMKRLLLAGGRVELLYHCMPHSLHHFIYSCSPPAGVVGETFQALTCAAGRWPRQ